jgi:GT2 family glycosyltransferase
MTRDFSVVICAYDERRWNLLRQAVSSVGEQTLPPHEVIVVVDHNDSLLARARRDLPHVRVVRSSGPRGLHGARNTGVHAATANHVAFLDDDAYATKRWLELLAKPFSDDDVAGVGGPAWPIWEGGRPSWFPPEFEWVVGCHHRGMSFGQNEVRNLWGVNMSFRRDLLLTIGGFRIGIYCDETELCIRLRQRWPGKRLVLLPEARVMHHVGKSRTTVRRFLERCYYEGGSKAVLSRHLGARDALASERRYTWEILPRGVGRGIADFVLDHDPHGLARAGLIVGGLATTTAGYAVGHLMPTRTARRRGWVGELGGRPSSRPYGDEGEGAR